MKALLKQALEALEHARDWLNEDQSAYFEANDAIDALTAELAKPEPEAVAHSPTWFDIIDKYQRPTQLRAHPPCSRHPDAPHGCDWTATYRAKRHVCECESWVPGEAS